MMLPVYGDPLAGVPVAKSVDCSPAGGTQQSFPSSSQNPCSGPGTDPGIGAYVVVER